jgi:hypothetical protein
MLKVECELIGDCDGDGSNKGLTGDGMLLGHMETAEDGIRRPRSLADHRAKR